MYNQIRPDRLRFKPISPFGKKDDFKDPKIWDRIDDNISLGKINTLAIEGASQVGKSTFSEMMAKHYDPDFVTWYNTEDVFKTMDWLKDQYYDLTKDNPNVLEAIKPLLYKWYIFEEADAEAPKTKWRSERNQAIIRVINMYGFLKPNLILNMPDMDELGPGFLRNITYRIFIDIKKRHGEIIRKATFYRPYKIVGAPKWKWYPIGEFLIPKLELDNEYYRKKLHNFFEDKIPRYKNYVQAENQRWIPEAPYIPKPLSEAEKDALRKQHGIDPNLAKI